MDIKVIVTDSNGVTINTKQVPFKTIQCGKLILAVNKAIIEAFILKAEDHSRKVFLDWVESEEKTPL